MGLLNYFSKSLFRSHMEDKMGIVIGKIFELMENMHYY